MKLQGSWNDSFGWQRDSSVWLAVLLLLLLFLLLLRRLCVHNNLHTHRYTPTLVQHLPLGKLSMQYFLVLYVYSFRFYLMSMLVGTWLLWHLLLLLLLFRCFYCCFCSCFACCVYSKILNKLLPHLQLRKSMQKTKIHNAAYTQTRDQRTINIYVYVYAYIVDLFVWPASRTSKLNSKWEFQSK